ncbi:unnamed protein product, partial [Ectocarpus sp. 12 AP-2014]
RLWLPRWTDCRFWDGQVFRGEARPSLSCSYLLPPSYSSFFTAIIQFVLQNFHQTLLCLPAQQTPKQTGLFPTSCPSSDKATLHYNEPRKSMITLGIASTKQY